MVRWTPDVHEALLVAIAGSGLLPSLTGPSYNAIAKAWPANKGPIPTRSALAQQMAALARKHGGGRTRAAGGGGGGTARSNNGRAAPASRGNPGLDFHKPGRERHQVDMSSDDDNDDGNDEKPTNEERFEDKIKLEKVDSFRRDIVDSDSSTPTVRRGVSRHAGSAKNAAIVPRAGLSPAAGLGGGGGTAAVTGSNARAQSNPHNPANIGARIPAVGEAMFEDDPLAHLPMTDRHRLLKQNRLNRFNHMLY